jgi:NADPH:quinone reductase-like Zn-dependent oxidoreductase
MYAAPPGSPQDILGLEYAGVVDALGAGAEGFAVGDRVMGIVGGGGYAEYVVTPAPQALAVPPRLTIEEAAAIPEAFLTAYDALEQLEVKEGQWVLVHAVGSGVGTAAVQLIRARGARSIGSSRTPAKLERALSLGMDEALDGSTEELVASIRRITGQGAHAAMDLIGGPGFNETLRALVPRGRSIIVGLTAGSRAEVDLGLILRQRLRIVGTTMRVRSAAEKAALSRSFGQHVLPLFAADRIRPVIDTVFDFQQVREAHEYMESNANFGKVVVRIS